MRFAGRLRDYGRIAATLGTWPALILLWLGTLAKFLANMLPRFNHLSAGGMKIVDPPCGSPECDFSIFWPAGLAARTGHAESIYQQPAFLAFRQQLFAPAIDPTAWLYPPFILLPAMPFSWLPYETAFIVWTLVLTLASILLLRLAALPWLVICAALLSPASLWNFQLGQLGLLIGSILVCGVLLADKKPWCAGAILGLLIGKPQAAVLLPVAMLAAGKTKVIAACAVAILAALLATCLAFGWPVWRLYLTQGLAAAKMVLQMPPRQSGYEKFGISVFWMLRYAGAGIASAYAVQAAVTLLSAVLAWRIWRGPGFNPVERMALTVFCSLLASPYGFTLDMVGYSIALAALARQRNWRIDPLDVLFWLWPALCPIVTMRTGILLTPVIVALAIVRTWRRAGEHLPALPPVLPGTA